MKCPTLFLLLSLAGCFNDETLTGYGAADTTWALQSIDDIAFSSSATISFPEEGKIVGTAPCNSYFAKQTAPYPWFEVSEIASTKRACPELSDEATFFQTLTEMTISEVSPTTLILSNDAKRMMVFTPK